MEPLIARLRIGLTGGIGTGKSTVAAMLVRHGAALVDTDAIAHLLSGPGGAAMPALMAAFGASVVAHDGSLHRSAMRQLAFSDQSVRRRLESILHPLIAAEAQRQSGGAAQRVIVFDVPLLAASPAWRARVDRILVIDCSEATQIERVAARPGWTRETVQQALSAQSTRAQRRATADALIVNDSIDLPSLQFEVDVLWRLWNND